MHVLTTECWDTRLELLTGSKDVIWLMLAVERTISSNKARCRHQPSVAALRHHRHRRSLQCARIYTHKHTRGNLRPLRMMFENTLTLKPIRPGMRNTANMHCMSDARTPYNVMGAAPVKPAQSFLGAVPTWKRPHTLSIQSLQEVRTS